MYICDMDRLAYSRLLTWKATEGHKPLIIRGARQVGKTWLMRTFGAAHYKQVAYINMESSPLARDLFTADYDVKRILLGLQIETGIAIDSETLLIFDEIQEAPRAITALKYFQEDAPQYDIICAGSLLGVAIHQQTSFPVGKVEFIDLYPMNFTEFLLAVGEKSLVELLTSKNWAMINTFAPKLIEWLRHYYFVGGMPDAVRTFAETRNHQKVRVVQRNILMAYEQDFSKHAPPEVIPRIRMLWNSLPAQLAKENKKFIYGIVRKGARAKDFEMALAWLKDCGLIHQVHNVSKPSIPLKAYENFSVFKIFTVDIGLLGAMTGLDVRTLLEGNAIFQEFKGALTEQYVLQQLKVREDIQIYYWSPDHSRAEVDLLVQYQNEVIPIEIKAEENLRAKSLRTYCEKYQPPRAYRISMSNYREETWMTNLPLYAIGAL